MTHSNTHNIVATLVAGANGFLPQALLDAALNRIISSGAQARLEWLAENVAADIITSGMTIEVFRTLLQDSFQSMPVDIIIQPEATRRKKFLIADMESTIIEQEMLDELAAAIGVGERVADITRRAMNGELDFTAALKERVGLLKGQPEKLLENVGRKVTFMAGAETLLATMRAHEAQCWLVSGGFSGFAAPIAHHLGFTEAYANHLIVRDGVIAGEVVEPVLDKNTKKALLERACVEQDISLADTLAVGDGANDIPMLAASNIGGGLGVAYHAKPTVRAAIPHQINHGDLTVLLYAQGYRREDFREHKPEN